MQIKHGSLITLFIVLAGCGGGSNIVLNGDDPVDSNDEVSNEDDSTQGEALTRESLVSLYAGATFVSVETLEIGPTPTGVALGNWTVSFTSDNVTWNYSDVVEEGTYTVDNSANPVATLSRDIAFSGDGVTLEWDGLIYRRLETSLFDSQESLSSYLDGSTYISVEEFDVGENAFGELVLGNWSLDFSASEVTWNVQDTVQISDYAFISESSFATDFGVTADTVYVLTDDQLLFDAVIYEQ